MTSSSVLRRYTNLSSTLHLLQNRSLTLLNPSSWDDRNDAFFVAEYKRCVGAMSVLALCFAEARETYHHWRVFSSGSDGVCLEFDKSALEKSFDKNPRLIYRSMRYKKISQVTGIEESDLPFVKRSPYSDEREFRVLYVDSHAIKDFMSVPIPRKSILRITLSPWMPIPLATAVKQSLKSVRGCSKLQIFRSTLIENERWKRAASP